MGIKIFFISLGCDKNLIDSEIMLGLIDEEGYEITSDETEADIIIVNSCGFIMDANQEAIDNILRVADYKTTGKLKGLIVTGCMAQRYSDEIFKELPEVDAVIGTGDFENIGSVIKKLTGGEKRIKLITDKNKVLDYRNSMKRIITSVGGFSYLKIAEGCDSHCTYCTIPSLRGRYRSRTMESLVEEGKMLAEKGISEIILIAQDTSLYGTDLYGEKKLPELLERLSQIEGIKWLRILYCYPENITDKLIETIKTNKKVCHYIDMPVQSGNNEILKRMGRRSTREKLLETIEILRREIPDIALRTTFITGFPGETQEQFEDTCDFIEKAQFDRLGVFTYSREEGTPAAKMPDQTDEEIKAERKEAILDLQRGISAKRCESFVGKILDVIVEGTFETNENGYIYCGRSFRDCYEIDGFVFFESKTELIAGDFYKIKITAASDYDLTGEMI